MPDSVNTAADNLLRQDNVFGDVCTVTDRTFVFALSGQFTGTVTLQVRPVLRDITQHDWVDEQTYTVPTMQQSIVLRGQWQVRAGFKPGGFVGGAAHVTIIT